MDPIALEWLNLLVRWFHFVAGIMWIGSSIFFNWLDGSLTRPDSPREGVEGELWMVHSGGFYQVEKRHLAPSQVPRTLHWFKWEAAFTGLSGLVLLAVVYYLGGGALLVDPSVSGLGHGEAVALGVGLLVASWFVYDGLWASPLKERPGIATAVSLALVGAVAWGLAQVFSGRAAYIHVGAMLGTVMVGNVWARILPAQHQMIAATRAGRMADQALGAAAKTRSRHNNYMTFPVLFIMISNHFPSTYGHRLNWLVLGVLVVASGLVKHFMNVSDRFRAWLPASVATGAAALVALYLLTAPPRPSAASPESGAPPAAPVSFTVAHGIVHHRCASCHAPRPTDPAFPQPPLGIELDTPEKIRSHAERIKLRAVTSRTMPLANKTGMTAEERELLGRWIDAGARLE